MDKKYIFNVTMCDHTRIVAVQVEDKIEAENIVMVTYPDYKVEYQGELHPALIQEIAYVKA